MKAWRRWAVAGACAAAALLLRAGLSPILGDHVPFMLFAPAALVAAWYGGLLPGLAVVTGSAVLGTWFFLNPTAHALTVRGPDQWIQLLTFLITSTVLVAICAVLHRAHLRLSEQARALRMELDQRRQAEQALREMETLTHRVIDSNVIGIFIADLEGNIIDANDAFLGLLGYGRADVEAGRLNLPELTVPELRHLDQQAVEQWRIRGRHEPFETQCLRRDGMWVPVLVGMAALPGARDMRICYVLDLSGQKQVQQVLRDSEQRYRFLAESIPQIVWTARPDGVVNYTNKQFLDYVGQTRERAQKLGWIHFRHPDDRAEATAMWVRSVQTGEPYECMYRLLRGSDGSYRWHLARAIPMRDDAGRIVMWFGTCTDIDDQKRAEQVVRQSEEFFRAIFNQAAVGIGLTDVAGRWVQVNQRLCDITGYSAGELTARTFWELTAPEDRAANRELIEKLLAGVVPDFCMEKRYLRKDGSLVWANVTVGLLRGADGQPQRFIGVIEDISVRKRVEQELADASRTKDQFLAALSHELRTPLTPVVLAIDSLREDPALPERMRDDLEMMQRNVGLEAKLIDDLLDLTRVSRGKLELRHEVVDVHTLLDHAVRSCCGMDIEQKPLSVRMEPTATCHHVLADPARLEQVFFNILRNAVKFTSSGGRIDVRTHDDAQAHRVVIEISDDGVGIDPEVLPRIFNAFEQGDPAVTRQFGGLGLGLAVCRAIVDLHGGTIGAHSDGPQRGARFTVRLPLAPASWSAGGPDIPSAAPAARTDCAEPRRAKILLVEDHATTAAVLHRLLSRMEYDVKVAADLASARSLAQHNQFDLLVSDLGLPDGSGLELMRELRSRYQLRGIALTGYGSEEDMLNSQAAGFAEHLVKPVRFETLATVMQRVLNAPSAPQAGDFANVARAQSEV